LYRKGEKDVITEIFYKRNVITKSPACWQGEIQQLSLLIKIIAELSIEKQ
jgi:hypothetical protein